MFDAYIRVSSVKGRSGPSFISPDVQRDTIERLANANRVEVAQTVEDLDVSGAKRGQRM